MRNDLERDLASKIDPRVVSDILDGYEGLIEKHRAMDAEAALTRWQYVGRDMAKNIDLEDLLRRVEALERAVLGTAKPTKARISAPASAEDFSGATGGVRFLIAEGFFNSRRTFAEVEKEMRDNGYHYSRQAVQMPLTRLSTVGGPLVALKDKGKNVYVKRK